VYKDPRTGHKVTHVTPALSLGQVVHDVLEGLSNLPSESRFAVSLTKLLDVAWQKVEGKKGGFLSVASELETKARGMQMLQRVEAHPGVLKEKALKLKVEGGLPWFWLTDVDEFILSGKVDWLVYKEKTDSVQILDFKTGRNEESEESLQLPIYYLLVSELQKRPITQLSYWYLDKDDEPTDAPIPDPLQTKEKILEVARKIKLARQLNIFKCPFGGCRNCMSLERILNGEGEKVGVSEYNQDLYIL
jgi:ATP-dependent helicase/DNAse subunit B